MIFYNFHQLIIKKKTQKKNTQKKIQMKQEIFVPSPIFSNLYDYILQIDNDKLNIYIKYINRYTFINAFLSCLKDVNEKGEQSDYFMDYQMNQYTIKKFYDYIIKPCMSTPCEPDDYLYYPPSSPRVLKKTIWDEFEEDEFPKKFQQLQEKIQKGIIFKISTENQIKKYNLMDN
jgi:anthranilate/para-aminobenzoate synthase component I